MKGNIFGHLMEKCDAPLLPGVARREFLAGLGAAAILPVAFPRAQTPTAMLVRPYRIDTHNHFSAPGFIAAKSSRHTNQRALEQWTPSKAIEDMNRSGVAMSIISTSEPSVCFGDNEAARKLARECDGNVWRHKTIPGGVIDMAKYGKAAAESIKNALRREKKGTLLSGKGGKGGKVTSRKQAIAIALSEARKRGAKVPKKKA